MAYVIVIIWGAVHWRIYCPRESAANKKVRAYIIDKRARRPCKLYIYYRDNPMYTINI